MLRTVKILAIVIACLFAMPAALAGWMSYGSFEPDYAEDVTLGYMWDDVPNPALGKQVYFNAFATTSTLLGAGPTIIHNVGELETRFAPANQLFEALLGVWTDCNGDGYIGLAESAVFEYRAELGLHDPTVCPPSPANTRITHNDGAWITEFIYIRPEVPGDTRTYLDAEVIIWGDAGLPGADLATAGGSCPISPLPRGTLATTGGILKYADCGVGIGGAWNNNLAIIEENASIDTGLMLDDANNWNQPGHPLNVVVFGSEDSSESMMTVWDCNADPIASETVGGNDIVVRPVSPGSPNAGGTIAGTANTTYEGGPVDDCDYTNDNGGDIYDFAEGDHEGDSTTDKRAASWNFMWSPMARGAAPVFPLGVTSPQDLGLIALRGTLGSSWSSNAVLLGTTPAAPFRAGLVTDPANPGANPQLGANARYFTFYASLGASATALNNLVLPGGSATGTYGFEWCQGATTGIVDGFNCDEDVWNMNANTNTPMTPPRGVARFAVAGEPYNLRDIDCYDSTFTGAPYPASC